MAARGEVLMAAVSVPEKALSERLGHESPASR
jgi:hypothetical protein